MATKEINKTNPFLIRLKPNKLFNCETIQSVIDKKLSLYFNSKTDKEAYRVTLASMRSATLASNSPSNSGQYGFPAGTSLDIIRKYDDSYFRRPDLTIADIDQAIRDLKESCENLDEENRINIQKDIERAEEIKQSMEKSVNSNSNSDSATE